MQFIIVFFLDWRTSFQREWILEAHSHRFVAVLVATHGTKFDAI